MKKKWLLNFLQGDEFYRKSKKHFDMDKTFYLMILLLNGIV